MGDITPAASSLTHLIHIIASYRPKINHFFCGIHDDGIFFSPSRAVELPEQGFPPSGLSLRNFGPERLLRNSPSDVSRTGCLCQHVPAHCAHTSYIVYFANHCILNSLPIDPQGSRNTAKEDDSASSSRPIPGVLLVELPRTRERSPIKVQRLRKCDASSFSIFFSLFVLAQTIQCILDHIPNFVYLCLDR